MMYSAYMEGTEMSLNPSNGIAQKSNPTKHVFSNLARRTCNGMAENYPEAELKPVFDQVDAVIREELTEAGILDPANIDHGNYLESDWNRKSPNGCYKEVPSCIFAAKYGWKFERRWYYYAADGPGIPPERAEEFHKDWGTQVRVEGHCGCPSPLEYGHGFAVGSYHIDTQEGLNAFVKLLASIYRP